MSRNFKNRFDSNPKNLKYKKQIVDYYIHNGPDTLTVLSKVLDISVPTANKFVTELCESRILKNYGKLETAGGRHPFLYGLDSSECFFVGVDFSPGKMHCAVMNLCGERVYEQMSIPFDFANTQECLDSISAEVNAFIDGSPYDRDVIVAVGLNVYGRLNPTTGYSYTYFNFNEIPLGKALSKEIGIPTYIDNDSRACAYGEYMTHFLHHGRNLLFVNIAWGLGLGIILDGKPYNGKSGFSGEFGHIYAYDNEVLCHCGKKGCIQTEASGIALHRKFIEKIKQGGNSLLLEKYNLEDGPLEEQITLDDLIVATQQEDILCIDILEEVGEHLGRQVSGLINLFNPDIIVIGGPLSKTGDSLMHPLRSSIRKYSLNMVNQDTALKVSYLQGYAGVMGACMLARKKALESLAL
ncbi:MAG: ROK family protein [Porphyromonas sp.]|nr:ROK family protein [Porphyromonas sp.]